MRVNSLIIRTSNLMLTSALITAAVPLRGDAVPQSLGRDSASAARYTLSVRPTRPQYRVGEPIWLEITVRNVSNSDLEHPATSEDAAELRYTADVSDSAGHPVPEKEFERNVRKGTQIWIGDASTGLGGPPPRLGPGKSGTLRIDLAKRFDLRAPGRYAVEIERRDDSSGTKVKSNRIVIDVR